MTKYRVRTIEPGYLALFIKVGEEWKRSDPLLNYDLEFEPSQGSITGTILDVLKDCDCFDDFKLQVRQEPKEFRRIEKRSKWHRVEDKLPKPCSTVLAYYNGMEFPFVAIYSSREEGRWYSDGHLCGVTHWRELPKLPKRAGDE